MTYGKTVLQQTFPWGLYKCAGSRVLCSDGKVRALAYLANTSDTFFSIPAAVRIKGKYISGYVTGEDASLPPYKVERRAWAFRQHTESNEKAGNPLPVWPSYGDKTKYELLKDGEQR
jgi:hypothetical protein